MSPSLRSVQNLSKELGEAATRFEALRHRVRQLRHKDFNGEGAYFVGVSHQLARSIHDDIELLGNTLYLLGLHMEKIKEEEAKAASNETRQTPEGATPA